jgi:hypothetical protein
VAFEAEKGPGSDFVVVILCRRLVVAKTPLEAPPAAVVETDTKGNLLVLPSRFLLQVVHYEDTEVAMSKVTIGVKLMGANEESDVSLLGYCQPGPRGTAIGEETATPAPYLS